MKKMTASIGCGCTHDEQMAEPSTFTTRSRRRLVAEDKSNVRYGSARLIKLQTSTDGGSEVKIHRKEAVCGI